VEEEPGVFSMSNASLTMKIKDGRISSIFDHLAW
jgi:hypothetical protein